MAGFKRLLVDLHTHRFDERARQYLEAAHWRDNGHLLSQQEGARDGQTTLDNHLAADDLPSFGHFGDPDGYSGYIPSKNYLVSIFNKLVERDEYADINLTSLMPTMTALCMDDNFKLSKHLAHFEGTPIFRAFFTVMSGYFIRGQNMTYTKALSERAPVLAGITRSILRYNTGLPTMIASDDPPAFAALTKPFAESLQGRVGTSTSKRLTWLVLPEGCEKVICDGDAAIEEGFREINAEARDGRLTLVQVDAEWDRSRKQGVDVLILMKQNNPMKAWVMRVCLLLALPPARSLYLYL